MSDYLIRAVLALGALSILVGPLGSLAVWRRMGYFGDAASHAALLGVALSLMFQLPLFVGTGLIAIAIALYISSSLSRAQTSDGLLGVIAHGSLALAVLILAVSPQGRGNLEAYLFGDVLTISSAEVAGFLLATILMLLVMIWRWDALIYSTLNEEMAAAHGLNPHLEARIYTLILALAVAFGIGIVGALLMGAFLIVPAMAAQNVSRSPESMVGHTVLFALISSASGFLLSYYFDLPTAPAMVVCASAIFFISQLRKTRM